MLRILGAVRLSNLTDETTSPVRQKSDILADPLTKMGELVDWAEDLDVSADKFSPFARPKLGPWLVPPRVHEYDVLSFAKADRAIRSMMDMYELSKWAQKYRKVIVFVKGPSDGPRMELDFRNGPLDPITQLIVTIFAFAGEIELSAIKGRTKDSQSHARAEGRWHGGLPPYGYRAVKQPKGEGWKLGKDPEAVKTLEEIIKRVLAGDSLNSICRDFNESGVLSPRDHFRRQNGKPLKHNKWTSVVISGILRSKALLGYSMHEGKLVRNKDGLPVMQADPVVERHVWHAVQRKLDENSIKKPRTRSTSPLLGVVFCSHCGSARYRYTSSAPGKPDYYRCRNTVWKSGCLSKSIRGDFLAKIIEDLLLEHLGEQEIVEEVYIPGESHREELQEAQEGLIDLLERSAGKPAAVKEVYDRQIASLEALIERLSALPEVPSSTRYVGTGQTYRGLWEASDLTERRRLLLDAGIRIEAAPAGEAFVSIGRFERPEREDQVVIVGSTDGIQYAFYVPKNILDVTTRQSSSR